MADPVLQNILEAVERLRPHSTHCSISVGEVKVEVNFRSEGGTITPLTDLDEDEDEDDVLGWSSKND